MSKYTIDVECRRGEKHYGKKKEHRKTKITQKSKKKQ